jgi:hydroxymethylbilane synthase
VALLNNQADLAVHSLKDLPTELPEGLELGAVGKRADVRDVLIYRDADYFTDAMRTTAQWCTWDIGKTRFQSGLASRGSSSRRRGRYEQHPAQGPVGGSQPRSSNCPISAATFLPVWRSSPSVLKWTQQSSRWPGFSRLNYSVSADGTAHGRRRSQRIVAAILDVETMLTLRGAGSHRIEVRKQDERIAGRLRVFESFGNASSALFAERSFLAAMGRRLPKPVAAYARWWREAFRMRALSFAAGTGAPC